MNSGAIGIYPLVMTNSLPRKITMLLIGKPSINGSFSMAMLNNQRVIGILWEYIKASLTDRIIQICQVAGLKGYLHFLRNCLAFLQTPPLKYCDGDIWVCLTMRDAPNMEKHAICDGETWEAMELGSSLLSDNPILMAQTWLFLNHLKPIGP